MTVLMPEDFKPDVVIISQNDFNVKIHQLLNDFLRNIDTEIKAEPPQALLLRQSKIAAVVRVEWSPQPRATQSHSIFNSNKQ
jgi:hypothetical protein